MNQKSWVGILSAVAMLATGIAAWAAENDSVGIRDTLAPSLATSSLLAGRDLTGVSAPPSLSNGAGEEGDASKSSGPPGKSVRSLARHNAPNLDGTAA